MSPVYCLKCEKCKYEWEKYFATNDKYADFLVDGKCPECGSIQYYRIPSILGFRRDHTVNP